MQMNTGEINLNGGLAGGKDNQGRHEIEGEKAAKEKKKGRILLVLRTNGVTHYTAVDGLAVRHFETKDPTIRHLNH